MKKSIYAVTLLLLGAALCVPFTSSAQDKSSEDPERQAYLDKVIAKEKKYAALEENLSGWRFGGEYSARRFNTIDVRPAVKRGLHATAGYRFNKHWYVGGLAGVDLTCPFEITRDGYVDDKANYSVTREDKIYVPIMVEPRFYFNYAKTSVYLCVDAGYEISSSSAATATLGLGLDYNIKNSKCVNIAFSLGMGSWDSCEGDFLGASDDPGYEQQDGFVLGFKIGFSL